MTEKRTISVRDRNQACISVVIPCYRVTQHILSVISKVGQEVSHIYVVDDCCPDESGKLVRDNCSDSRVKVLYNHKNQGVGGAVMRGYQAAIKDGTDIIVKIDGDGQMNPALISTFVAPILLGEADYTKGNRFFNLEYLSGMPYVRLFGNAVLSFLTKLSSGYWDLFDPTNGYTAIHSSVALRLPLHKISRRFFFETDILFRLNVLRAVVVDVPMEAVYMSEVSNLKVSNVIGEFLLKNMRNTIKRLFYNYYLRNFSVASIELPLGVLLLGFGMTFGGYQWAQSLLNNIPASAGTVMVSSLPV